MRYARSALSVLAVVGLLTLASCSSGSDDGEAAPTAPPIAVTTTQAPDIETTSAPETTEAPFDNGNVADTPFGEQPTESEIIVTVDGADVEFTPTKVECDGEEGDLRRLVGKVGDGPPLVEVTWTKYVMVKLDEQTPPYEAQLAEGLTFGDLSATFRRVALDGATLNGTLVCTDREN